MSEGQQRPLNRFEYVPLATFLCQWHKVSDVRFINPFPGMVHAHDVARKTVLGVEVVASNVPWVHGQAVSCTLQSNMIRNSPQPPDPFKHPRTQTPMEHDVNAQGVAIYGVTCRRHWLVREPPRGFAAGGFPEGGVAIPLGEAEGDCNLKCVVRLNFQHQHMAQLQDTATQQKIFAAAGAERGGFAVLGETGPDGMDINELPMRENEFGLQNEQYTKTMMLVNESNLMNGIIQIPEEVCRASRLPVWTGEAPAPDERMLNKLMASMKIDPATEQGQQEKQALVNKFKRDFEESFRDYERSTFYYAVPKRHVLAWGFSSEAYTDMHDVRVEKFRFVHADTRKVKLLYYLVPNMPFERFVEYFKRDLMGKTDRRPLSSVGFEFLPRVPTPFGEGVAAPAPSGPVQQASIRLRAYISYFSVPGGLSAGTIKGLAPTLCKGFPLPHNWSEDEVARQIAIEEAMLAQEQKGKKFNK
jgi:hypothetical protein